MNYQLNNGNIKNALRDVSHYFAVNSILACKSINCSEQMAFILLCKELDELQNPDKFKNLFTVFESPEKTRIRILELFSEVKKLCSGILKNNDEILLDEHAITYVVERLQNIEILKLNSGAFEDMYEIFSGYTHKSGYGQFFTPKSVVDMILGIIEPDVDDAILDTSCGSGIFLREAGQYVNALNNKEAQWSIRGIEKDPMLSKISGATLKLAYGTRSEVYCEDALSNTKKWKNFKGGKADIILSNPPFGVTLKIDSIQELQQYELGHKWKKNKGEEIKFSKTSEKAEVLFIERNIQLLKDYGKMAMILPDGVLGNETCSLVRKWLLKHGRILAVIDLPLTTFQPYTSTKTSAIIFQKTPENICRDYDIFMAIAENCGHDSRGNDIRGNDLNDIVEAYRLWSMNKNIK